MYGKETCSYSLKTQCRFMDALLGDNERHRFIIGTKTKRKRNEIHVIEYKTDKNELINDKKYINNNNNNNNNGFIYEINDIKPHPKISSHLFVIQNIKNQMDGILYKLEGINETNNLNKNNKNNIHTTSTNIENNTVSDLTQLASLPVKNINKLCWNLEGNLVGSINNNIDLQIWQLDGSKNSLMEQNYFHNEESNNDIFHNLNICFDPHNTNQISLTIGNKVKIYDKRSKNIISTISTCHDFEIKDLDYNPNKEFFFVTGGDDSNIKIWDHRKSNVPLLTISDHSHWVWSVKYNRFHDQLLLSGGSDFLVHLWRISSLSSVPLLLEENNINSNFTKSISSLHSNDCKIKSYENHQDSVYSVVWGTNDPWIFASLSYDGSVVLNHVPSTEKYKILL